MANALSIDGTHQKQHLWILLIWLLTLLVFLVPAKALIGLSLQDQRYSHLAFAPLLTALLIFYKRDEVFADVRYAPRVGIPLLGLSLVLGVLFMESKPISINPTSLAPAAFAMVLSWVGAFILCYGVPSFGAAIYPLFCLLLAVPIPATWMDWINSGFQRGSANVTYSMFETLGVSVLRDGMNFSIPRLSFNIAPECSGIHSGQVFFIIGVVCAHLYLRTGWMRVILILSTIPIAVFKNAVRIVIITLLSTHVDRAFIDGPFHHKYSGLIFSPLDLVLFAPILFALRRIEVRPGA